MIELLIILACLAVNALLAAFEAAFLSVPRWKLRRFLKSGGKSALSLLRRRENPERTLSTVQIGITLVGALAAAVGGAGAADKISPLFQLWWGMSAVSAEILAVVLVVIPLTFLSVVLGELLPKSLALRAPMKILSIGVRWMDGVDRLISPVISAFEWSTKKLLRIFTRLSKSPAPNEPEPTIELDSLPPTHQQAVQNLAFFGGKPVSEMYVPWGKVVFVHWSDSMEDVAQIVFASGHTRLPVVKDGRVTGVLHTKEFLAYRETRGSQWQSIIGPALKIQSSEGALQVLRNMQNQHRHMAIVYSPQGPLLGIITLEDILEEFLGEIYDEDENSRLRHIFASRARARGLLR